ncbi:4-hydroxybenzoate polyprenyltransferase [Kaistella antarctica]|uniref:Prenyltransferase UbiA n=3 Tax=Kaistella antarctica TaxID=266748 RepID=A0ABR4U0I4_9FLAO|nr:prenyltransferase UbiA [Kaistella antarctica]SEV98669.1 4-hydroxybenzoate polyprenyltransferase [Kaistella antarctica]
MTLRSMKNPLFYRFSQFIAFLMGARVFVALLLTFALYVSTFFLFNQEESLRSFVFDFNVHGIIFCCILSILAGGIINQFYDREKDQVIKPFRTRVQNFLKQKYFLYAYIALNVISLGIAGILSMRVFFFFLVYQFLMWFYSHKLSKLLIINNLTFVSLSLYPFFGMLFYYKTFSMQIFLMSIFIFLMLLIIDVVKDTLTKNADKIFGYYTIPNYFSSLGSRSVIVILLILAQVSSGLIILNMGLNSIMSYYFAASILIQILSVFLVLNQTKYSKFINLNMLRIWIFVGIISMLANGIHQHYSF